ncbi:replication protein A subunit RPA32 [Flagelloscypha sp. PMI_526]|nr:replication protein A subunit RPA32 [Flagelloscypha sp. PMI_526]
MDHYSGGYTQSGGTPGSSSFNREDRSEASQALRPVTIAQLLRAEQTHTDSNWTLEGHELGQVTVVARCTKASQQATNWVFALDDGTSSLEARKWNNNPDDNWDHIQPDDYVRVSGNLKVFGGNSKRFLNASYVRKIEDTMYEPQFHILEVIYVHRCLTEGEPGSGGVKAERPNVSGTSAYSGAARSTGGPDKYAQLPEMQKRIVKFMLEAEPSDDGISVSEIVSGLRTGGHTADAISSALDSLLDEGHVYTTLDDAHFQLSD